MRRAMILLGLLACAGPAAAQTEPPPPELDPLAPGLGPDEVLPPPPAPPGPGAPAPAPRRHPDGPGALHVALAAPVQAPRRRIHVELEDVPLTVALPAIGRECGASLLVDPAVEERLTLSLRDIPWREAVDVIARMTRCAVEVLPGGVLRLSRPPRLDVAFQDGAVREVLATIGRLASQPLVVLPDVGGRVSVDLREATWEDALALVARAAGLRTARGPGYTLVGQGPLPELPARAAFVPALAPRVDVLAERQPLEEVMEHIGRAVGKIVLVDPEVDAFVSADLRNVPWGVAVDVLAREARCDVEVRPAGILVLVGRPRNAVHAVGAPSARLVEALAAYSGKNVAVGPGVDRLVTIDLQGVHWLTALHLVAWSQGLKVEEVAQDCLAVTRGEGGPPPLPPTAQDRYEDEVDRLLVELAYLARARRVRDAEVHLEALRALIAREEARVVRAAPAKPAELDALSLRVLERSLAAARRDPTAVDRLVQVLESAGEPAERALRGLVQRQSGYYLYPRATRAAISLALEVCAAERAIADIDAENAAGDVPGAVAAFRRLEAVATRLRKTKGHAAQGEALLARGEALAAGALRRSMVEETFGRWVRVTAVFVAPPDGREPDAAIVAGQVLREGDQVLDLRTGAPIEGLRVVEVTEAGVELRFEDTRFFQPLGR